METFVDLLTRGTELSLWAFVFLCVLSFVASFSTASFGAGGGVLALVGMAMVLSPAVLVPLNGVVQLGSNSFRAALMLKTVLWRLIPPFLIGTVIGAAVGGHFVVTLPVATLQIILGLFVLYAMWGPKFRAERPGKKTFFGLGVISTFASMFVGATGILVSPFSAAASDKRQEVVATHGALMTIQHGLKIVVFGILGFAFGPYIPLLAGMLAFGFLGTYAGKHMLNVLPEKLFRTIFKFLITALACRLLYAGVTS